MLMLLYSAALALGLLLASPWWLVRMGTTQRYREGFWQRLGVVPTALREAVRGKRVIWIHAVSVGEVLAATRLVEDLGQAFQDDETDWRIVISTTTRTGQALAQQRFDSKSAPSRVFYFPLDFAFAVRVYLRVLKPRALILMESELWPRMLHECAARKIPVVVANARVSDRSFARTQPVRKLWQRMARHVSLFLAQSEDDARRLLGLGALSTQIQTTGNLKYDIRAPRHNRVVDRIQQAAAGRPIVVAGSIADDASENFRSESEAMISTWAAHIRDRGAVLVLAPRHPENFERVHLSAAAKYPALRATELRDGLTAHVEIIVLDTIGDLAGVYGIADAAFVGGSLAERGGHNPLEPAQFGVPIIIGPHYKNFRDIVETMKAANAICVVKDEMELEKAFVHLLTDHEQARAMGERGRTVFEQQQGATKRTVDAVLRLLGDEVQP